MRTISLKPLLGAMLGVICMMALAAPAQANDREWQRHVVVVRHYHHPRPHVIYAAPPVIYAPPPVVYTPPPPPMGINLILPLNFR